MKGYFPTTLANTQHSDNCRNVLHTSISRTPQTASVRFTGISPHCKLHSGNSYTDAALTRVLSLSPKRTSLSTGATISCILLSCVMHDVCHVPFNIGNPDMACKCTMLACHVYAQKVWACHMSVTQSFQDIYLNGNIYRRTYVCVYYVNHVSSTKVEHQELKLHVPRISCKSAKILSPKQLALVALPTYLRSSQAVFLP